MLNAKETLLEAKSLEPKSLDSDLNNDTESQRTEMTGVEIVATQPKVVRLLFLTFGLFFIWLSFVYFAQGIAFYAGHNQLGGTPTGANVTSYQLPSYENDGRGSCYHTVFYEFEYQGRTFTGSQDLQGCDEAACEEFIALDTITVYYARSDPTKNYYQPPDDAEEDGAFAFVSVTLWIGVLVVLYHIHVGKVKWIHPDISLHSRL